MAHFPIKNDGRSGSEVVIKSTLDEPSHGSSRMIVIDVDNHEDLRTDA